MRSVTHIALAIAAVGGFAILASTVIGMTLGVIRAWLPRRSH